MSWQGQWPRNGLPAKVLDVGDDVIEISASGEIHTVLRSTLCLAEGSLLAMLFSGGYNNAAQFDFDGRPLLDVDPYVFSKILSFLRLRKMAGPGKRVPLPQVETTKRPAFAMTLAHYGLSEFFFGSAHTTSLSLPTQTNRKTHLVRQGDGIGYCVEFKTPIRLSDVYVGLEGCADGCMVNVTKSGEVVRSLPLVAKHCGQDPHVTHVAEGFDLEITPPHCFIAFCGNGSARVRFRDQYASPEGRLAGCDFRLTTHTCHTPVLHSSQQKNRNRDRAPREATTWSTVEKYQIMMAISYYKLSESDH